MSADEVRDGGIFEGVDFEDVALSGRRLSDAELDACRFLSCDLSEARLEDCSFIDCELRSCDLTLTRVGGTSFRGVRFVECRLLGVDWTEAATALGLEIVFERCVLDGSSFVGLRPERLKMVDCRAREVNFAGADLTGASFPGTSLAGARFQGTTLTRADLSGALDVLFDPAENRLDQTRLSLEAAVGVLGVAGIVVEGM